VTNAVAAIICAWSLVGEPVAPAPERDEPRALTLDPRHTEDAPVEPPPGTSAEPEPPVTEPVPEPSASEPAPSEATEDVPAETERAPPRTIAPVAAPPPTSTSPPIPVDPMDPKVARSVRIAGITSVSIASASFVTAVALHAFSRASSRDAEAIVRSDGPTGEGSEAQAHSNRARALGLSAGVAYAITLLSAPVGVALLVTHALRTERPRRRGLRLRAGAGLWLEGRI
jgi:hypothetical protein